MSDDRSQDLERISAFVDGELDPAARAEVIRESAEDDAFARELLAQQRLKAALADSVDVPEIAITAPAPPRRRRLVMAATAIAASLVLLAAAALIGTVYHRQGSGDLAFDRAIELHRAWTVDTDRSGPRAALRPASATIDAYLPDLSSNGLNLGHVSERAGPDGNGMLVAGYVGSRGCRVTLLVRKATGAAPAQPIYLETGPLLAFSWWADRLEYRLLAEGMATPRFRLIATSVRRASLNHLPLDTETRTAMARSRAESPPCAA